MIAYSPMASGLLTGSFNREGIERLADDDWRRKAAPFQEPALSRNLALVEALEPIAGRLDATVSALAIAWVLAVPGVTAAIVGGRRRSQLDDWLHADAIELDAKTLAEIDAATRVDRGRHRRVPQPPPVALPPGHGNL